MLMAKIEALKAALEKQTTHIVEDIIMELNAQNVGGDLYKVGRVLEKIKAANELIFGKASRFIRYKYRGRWPT